MKQTNKQKKLKQREFFFGDFLICIFRPRVVGVAWAELIPPIGPLLLGGGDGLAFLVCIHIQYEQTVQEHATYKLA